jgi:hypothetical protein
MSHTRLPPPQPPSYLAGPYPSSQKGGTLIAEDVTDLKTHRRRLRDPDGYRPSQCPTCGHGVMHVHDYRTRVLRADPERPATQVVRHRCAHPSCAARWLILPLLLARHLWRRWEVVEASTLSRRPSNWPSVPARTRRRWRARLQTAGRVLVQVLAASGSEALGRAAKSVGLMATRLEVVLALDLGLAEAAVLLHRLAPGLRLM